MAKIKEAIEDVKIDTRLLDERGPTRERLIRAEEVSSITGEVVDLYEQGNDRKMYTMRDAPIEKAHAKGQISDGQYQAAKKLYGHWYRAGLAGSFGQPADLNRVFGGAPTLNAGEQQAFHTARLEEAYKELGLDGDKNLSVRAKLVKAIVCEEMKPEEAGAKFLGWNNRPQAFAAAMTMLTDRLTGLCRLWGIQP